MTDVNFPQDFYLDDVGVWRLKKEKLAELEKPKPQTNEEWLRSCSTEELREFLFYVFGQGVMFGETHEKVPMFPDDEVVTVSVFDWWLKEKHE